MKKVEQIVSELTDKQLKAAFNEIVEWCRTGILADGIVRQCHREFEQHDYPMYAMEAPILFEIAKRAIEREHFR